MVLYQIFTMGSTSEILQGTIHNIPSNLLSVLKENNSLLSMWNNLTPLARNEWICRITIAKKEATKEKRLSRLIDDILDGKKRPCCRPGCPHHRESAKKRFT